METVVWVRDKRWTGEVYYTTAVFNNCVYKLEVEIEVRSKSEICWVALSSGKKRKFLDTFEAKPQKSTGGVKALVWAKNILEKISELLARTDKKVYICIGWSDNRRRDIYSRYLTDFHLGMINNRKVLIKCITQE